MLFSKVKFLRSSGNLSLLWASNQEIKFFGDAVSRLSLRANCCNREQWVCRVLYVTGVGRELVTRNMSVVT